jgi:hypothetical protein
MYHGISTRGRYVQYTYMHELLMPLGAFVSTRFSSNADLHARVSVVLIPITCMRCLA